MKKSVVEVMTDKPIVLSPNDTVHEAAAVLAEHHISGAPVVDDGALVGIVSEADLMRAAIAPAKVDTPRSSTMTLVGLLLRGQVNQPSHDATVASVMTDDVVTVVPHATIWEAASIMEQRGVKRVPVVDNDGHLAGIVSRADLVGAMARTDEDLRDDVREAISIAGEESVSGVEVEVERGTATVTGVTDRKSTKSIALKLAAQVPGILEVVDRLEFDSDDSEDIPRQKDPWAVGPLVKDE